MAKHDGKYVYLGIKGTVLALNRATAAEVWRTELKGSDFVSVTLDGDLFATAAGELFCLDPANGRIRWHNKLKGLGRGFVTVATSDSQVAAMAQQRQQQHTAAAAAATAAMAAASSGAVVAGD